MTDSIIMDVSMTDGVFNGFLSVNKTTMMGIFRGVIDYVPSETPLIQFTDEMIKFCMQYEITTVENPYDPENPDVHNYSIDLNQLAFESKMDDDESTEKRSPVLVSFKPMVLGDKLLKGWRFKWLKHKIAMHKDNAADHINDPDSYAYYSGKVTEYNKELKEIVAEFRNESKCLPQNN